ESLEQNNISVELIDLRSLTPIVQETIIQSVKKNSRVTLSKNKFSKL
ncbi:MAG: transketolase C-terminal domain-containing protein, partial [Candidatus Phytoplasma australasiaticum]|nr:transketolase C-terminal domain-containing protein [Candidatus Phytoplasma australasiaticum]